jgi:flagellar protein FlaF
VPAFTEAKRAYTNLDLPVQTARQSEYQIFAKITGQLQAVAAMEDSDVQKRALAIYENQKLWLALQEDLSHPDNAFPDQLKAGLISLAIFTQTHSSKVLLGREDIQPLIDVNICMMRGLQRQANG